MDASTSVSLVREYLLLGLRFDRVEEGYVDSFTGDPALRRAVAAEPQPDPADLAKAGRPVEIGFSHFELFAGFSTKRFTLKSTLLPASVSI